MKQETADVIIEKIEDITKEGKWTAMFDKEELYHLGLDLESISRFINSLVVEERAECICPPSNLKVGSKWVIVSDCPRHSNQSEYETDEEISLRMWEEYMKYCRETDENSSLVEQIEEGIFKMPEQPLYFPDWLKERK